jgi:hypothetical protein
VPQAGDIALVKYLLMKSQTLKIYQKSAAGQTYLEYLIDHISKACFVPYAACMEELLTRRVPITVGALASLWAHISKEAAALRWTIDEEWPIVGHAQDGRETVITPAAMPLEVEDVIAEAITTSAAPFSVLTRRSVSMAGSLPTAPVLATVSEASETSSPCSRKSTEAKETRDGSPTRVDTGPASYQESRQTGAAIRGPHRLQIAQPRLETIHSMNEREASSEVMISSIEDDARRSSAGMATGTMGAVTSGDLEPESSLQGAQSTSVHNTEPSQASDEQEVQSENGTVTVSDGIEAASAGEASAVQPALSRMHATLDDLGSMPVPCRHSRDTSQNAAPGSGLPTETPRPLLQGLGRSKSTGKAAVESEMRRTLKVPAAFNGAHSFGETSVRKVPVEGMLLLVSELPSHLPSVSSVSI